MHVPQLRWLLPLLSAHLPQSQRSHDRRAQTPTAVESRYYTELGSASAYRELLQSASSTDMNVVKFTAPWCRTCRAARLKLDYVAKRHPKAAFFSLDLDHDSETRLLFDELQIELMPHVEIFLGSERVESLVVPPSRVAFLNTALAQAQTLLRQRRRDTERAKVVLGLRAARQSLRRLSRERARLVQEWLSLECELGGARDEMCRVKRRRHLLDLRAKGRERAALRQEETRRASSGDGICSTSSYSGEVGLSVLV